MKKNDFDFGQYENNHIKRPTKYMVQYWSNGLQKPIKIHIDIGNILFVIFVIIFFSYGAYALYQQNIVNMEQESISKYQYYTSVFAIIFWGLMLPIVAIQFIERLINGWVCVSQDGLYLASYRARIPWHSISPCSTTPQTRYWKRYDPHSNFGGRHNPKSGNLFMFVLNLQQYDRSPWYIKIIRRKLPQQWGALTEICIKPFYVERMPHFELQQIINDHAKLDVQDGAI